MKKLYAAFVFLMATGTAIGVSVTTVRTGVEALCPQCGSALTSLDVLVGTKVQNRTQKLLCKKCWALRMKEGEQGVGTSSSFSHSVVPFDGGATDTGSVVHYGSAGLKQAAAELEFWDGDEFYDCEDTNPDYLPSVGLLFGCQKTLQQKKSVTPRASTPVASPTQPRWWYFFPRVIGRHPGNLDMQIFYGDHPVFGGLRDNPVRELWCQGSTAVVVTGKGYSLFDMEKQQQRFFSRREELDAYAQQLGIVAYENKILVKNFPSASVQEDAIFNRHQQRTKAILDQCQAECSERMRKIEAEFRASLCAMEQKIAEKRDAAADLSALQN